MGAIGQEMASSGTVPHTERLIGAGGGDAPTVGCPCDGVDPLMPMRVTGIGQDMVPGVSIPDLHIITGRGDARAAPAGRGGPIR
jgi:hypothetical protein